MEDATDWLFLYGRRKTGKTFLVRRFVTHDAYHFVKRDRTILTDDGDQLSYETLLEILPRDLEDGRTVVVDEFHRLGEDFLDRLHALEKHGKLILISSTLFLSKRLLDERSPLLGLVREVPVGLVQAHEALRAVGEEIPKKDRMELAVLLGEPLAADTVDPSRPARDGYRAVIRGTLRTVPALVGEVFTEERRRVTATYEGVMRAVATGRSVSGEIADSLYARRLIDKNDPSQIQSYLTNLVELGVLKKLRVFNKNRRVYLHASPLLHIFYHADERYNLSERQPSDGELDRIVDDVLPSIMEGAIRAALAHHLGLEEAVIQAPDHDIDACLLRFQKPEAVCEVKWKDTVRKRDLRRAEQTLERYDAPHRILFVPDKDQLPDTELEVLDPNDLLTTGAGQA